MEPMNPMESAVAKCNIEKLTKEINAIKKKNKGNEFDISRHIRTSAITALMRSEALQQFLVKENVKEERMMKMLEFLISQGLDFSKEEKDKTVTCLMRSTWSVRICRFLIQQHGAKLNATDGDGNTALFYAANAKEPRSVINLLLNNGIDFTVNLHRVLLNAKDDPVSKLLIEKCVDFEREAKCGELVQSVLSSRTRKDKIFKIAEQITEKVPYTDEQRVLIYEYLGCVSMLVSKQGRALDYWKKAVVLRSTRDIPGKGLPIDALQSSNHKEDAIKMLSLYFYAVEGKRLRYEEDNRRFIVDGIEFMFEMANLGHTDTQNVRDHREDVVHIVRFLANNYGSDMFRGRPQEKTDQKNGFTLSVYTLYMNKLVWLSNHLLSTAQRTDDEETATQLIAEMVEKNIVHPTEKFSILQIAVVNCTILNTLRMIRIMLDFGADSESRDIYGTSSYQMYLAIARHNKDIDQATLECFLKHGSHIDVRLCDNAWKICKFEDSHVCDRKRFYEYVRKNCKFENFQEMKYVSLKCLAARAVVDHEIEYNQGEIPVDLHEFIDLHKRCFGPPCSVCPT